MESKQKAKELVRKFQKHCRGGEGSNFELSEAKQCALIACDYSIEQLTPWKITYSGRKQIKEIQSVKQEITKL